MSHRSRTGFTLWDILIVVVLIAVVSAILFPVFQKPHNYRHGTCQSNMRQLALGYIQYTQDFDEKYPVGVNAAGNGWAGKILPYVKATRIYECANDPAEGSHVSYAQNQRLVGQSLVAFSAPAATVELYEFTTLNCDPATLETVSATGMTAPQDSQRHDPVTFAQNFLAADGHVKRLTPAQVSSGLNAIPAKKAAAGVMTFAIK